MEKHYRYLLLFLLTGSLICSFTDGYSQSRKRKHSVRDSLRTSILRRDSMMQSLKRSDTSLNSVLKKVEYYSNSFNQISVSLSRGFDTTEISQQLPRFEKRIVMIKGLIDKDKSSTLRYLYAIRDILTHAEDQLKDWQDDLADNNSKLVQMGGDLAEIKKDSVFKVVPADTSIQKSADEPIKAILAKHRKLDSLNKTALLKIGLLQNRVADIYLSILDQKDQINTKIRDFSEQAFSDEYDYIWAMKPTPGTTFASAFTDTFNMNFKLLKLTVNRNSLIHLAGVSILVLFFIWVYTNRRKILRERTDPTAILKQTTYVANHAILSAIIVCTVIQPYFYDHPPAVFLECIFLVSILAVLFMVKNTCAKPLYNFLLIIFGLTIVYAVSNLFVEVSNFDRVTVLIMSCISVWATYRFMKNINDTEEYPPHTRTIARVYIFFQLLSVLCNIMGRFSLAKIIGVTVTFNLWTAISLYLLVQILMQGLFLQLEANKNDSIISSYVDFKLLQRKFRNVLNTLAVILWIIMLAQNLSVEDLMYDTIYDFLRQSRNLGGTGFTFGSIIIFIAVIWLSSITARIISYFYDFADQHRDNLTERKKNKTSMLLVRLSIFAIGFFLAVAASGFPLDKITIIISAFGVGIGFGLQNIVNNLVSGLILAFEKPVQIGDIIEVANRSGTIKEIGIRSSKILTGDGAEVIIPNGDLISNHVINWTLSNNNRRVELIIGVAYGSDIAKVKQLLTDLLCNRDDIMVDPAPVVLVHNLNESSVDFRILFWAADITVWQQLKSKIITEIYNTFNAEGIEMPFPQRDVHLHVEKGEELLVTQAQPQPVQNLPGTNVNPAKISKAKTNKTGADPDQ